MRAPVTSASTCALGCTPCATACDGGCPAPVGIGHRADTCGAAGAFDLKGTAYESTCATGAAGCVVAVPPFRFWQQGSFASANQGCEDLAASPWVAQASRDLGRPVADGHWVVDGMTWQGSGIDGCVPSSPGARLVSELSFVDAAREGTTGHRAFYAVTTVDATAGGFDLDRVTGGDGCNPATVKIAEVPTPGFLVGSGQFGGSYLVSQIQPSEVRARFFSELGADLGASPFAGFEIMYTRGPRPTTSDVCAGGWLPARSDTDPAKAKGVIPFNAPFTFVLFPGNCYPQRLTDPLWVAYRLVYEDPLNPVGPYDLASPGPRLATPVGGHVALVNFEPPTAWADVAFAAGTAAPGVPLTINLGIQFGYSSGARVEVAVPACIDATDFDPVARPWQITWFDTRPSVTWNSTSRLLSFDFPHAPRYANSAEIRGLRAGGADPSCCLDATLLWQDYCGWVSDPLQSCVSIDPSLACSDPAAAVTALTLVGDDDGSGNWRIDLAWDEATDAETVSYHVYRIVSGDASAVPVANHDGALRRDDIQFVTSTTRSRPFASDYGFSPPTAAPALYFYQVRGVCSDGSEGTSHPY